MPTTGLSWSVLVVRRIDVGRMVMPHLRHCGSVMRLTLAPGSSRAWTRVWTLSLPRAMKPRQRSGWLAGLEK